MIRGVCCHQRERKEAHIPKKEQQTDRKKQRNKQAHAQLADGPHLCKHTHIQDCRVRRRESKRGRYIEIEGHRGEREKERVRVRE